LILIVRNQQKKSDLLQQKHILEHVNPNNHECSPADPKPIPNLQGSWTNFQNLIVYPMGEDTVLQT